jgi:hypothetical protein
MHESIPYSNEGASKPMRKKNLDAKMRGSIVHIEAAGREVRR